jgi:hypothetical protein
MSNFNYEMDSRKLNVELLFQLRLNLKGHCHKMVVEMSQGTLILTG